MQKKYSSYLSDLKLLNRILLVVGGLLTGSLGARTIVTLSDTQGHFISAALYPAALLPEFFNGHVKLAPKFGSMLQSSRLGAPIIEKMNEYLKKCDARQKELFIDIINQKLERLDVVSDFNVDDSISYVTQVVDHAIALTDAAKKNDWLRDSSAISSMKQSFSTFFTKHSIEDLVKKALAGDKDALEKIHKIVIGKGSLSAEKQQKLLDNLESQASELIQNINVKSEEKTRNIQDNHQDDPEMLQDIALQQEANTRAVIKYSKDILNALRPISSKGQLLMSIVDRTTLSPVFNVINFKDFSLDGIRTDAQLKGYISSRITALEKDHSMHVPEHRETRPLFFQHVQDVVENHYADALSQRVYKSLVNNGKRAIRDHEMVHALPPRLQEKVFEKLARRSQESSRHEALEVIR